MKFLSFVLAALVSVMTPTLVLAAEPDWKAVEQALGRPGQLQPGGFSVSGCH